jgi:uncharacterized protein YjbI with pentapeptide repeats
LRDVGRKFKGATSPTQAPIKNASIGPTKGVMSDAKPRKSADPLYLLLREGRIEEFNRRYRAGETCDLRGCDFRGIDLRGLEASTIDFSDGYFRQADLRGLDLRGCRMHGASLHAAHVSGTYFPTEVAAVEIEMSVRLGTRIRSGQ